MTAAPALTQAIRQTVQDIPDARAGGASIPLFFETNRGAILSPWGTLARDRQLRAYDRYEHNNLWQGAVSGLAKKVASTPWEIAGPRKRVVAYYQDLFRGAQFGEGWTAFIKRWVREYMRADRGVTVEITAPGSPNRDPIGPATMISVLDSLRTYPTGDPLYPIVYYDRKGDYHLLPAGRISRAVDMPDTDEAKPGYGLCALSRYIAVAQRQILMGRYIEMNLDDKPQPGLVVASGMTEATYNKMIASHRKQQQADEKPVFGSTVWIYSVDPQYQVSVTPVTFSVPPQKFDFVAYVNLDVKELALAIGVDLQELWELTGGGIGTGAQSEILASKSKGKALGDIYATLERSLNDVLPPDLEFRFKPRDSQADQAEAQNAQVWTSIANTLGSTLTPDEQRRLLADKVEAIANVITDPSGQIVRLGDADVQAADEVTAEDKTPLDNAQQQPADTTQGSVTKAIEDAKAAFVQDFTDMINQVQGGDMNRRRAGIVMRAMLRRYGQQAFTEGMKAGGVSEPPSNDELAQVQRWMVEQSGYVTKFLNEVAQKGLSADQVAQRADLWAGNSLGKIYTEGLVAANKNAMYEWVMDGTAEHCATCQRLNGQIHRMKQWYAKDLLPKSKKLDCTLGCKCSLNRTTEPARGRF